MLNNYIGILSLSEDESNLRSLTLSRPLASIPIFGRYRIIDFVLSNMVNAGIKSVGIFTQAKSRSIIDHIGTGKPWDLNRKMGGIFIFNYSLDNPTVSDVKLIRDNMEYLYRSKGNYVILASSRMLCNINMGKVAHFHELNDNDVTIVYKSVKSDDEMFLNCDVLNMDENQRVMGVGKIIGLNRNVNISMEIFLMKKEFLIECIYKGIEEGKYPNFKNYIYNNTYNIKIGGYEFKGYLSCINSIRSYFKTSMDILDLKIREELFFENGMIYTKSNDSPPTKYYEGSAVKNSIVSNGCLIKGNVKDCIISRGVRIEEGALVENSVIFANCIIGKDAVLKNVILDKNVVIEDSTSLIGDRKFPVVAEKREVIRNVIKKVGGA